MSKKAFLIALALFGLSFTAQATEHTEMVDCGADYCSEAMANDYINTLADECRGEFTLDSTLHFSSDELMASPNAASDETSFKLLIVYNCN